MIYSFIIRIRLNWNFFINCCIYNLFINIILIIVIYIYIFIIIYWRTIFNIVNNIILFFFWEFFTIPSSIKIRLAIIYIRKDITIIIIIYTINICIILNINIFIIFYQFILFNKFTYSRK